MLENITPEKRQYVRVPFLRGVQLSRKNKSKGEFTVRNLSQGGMYLAGAINLPVGEDSRIDFHDSGRLVSMLYQVNGKIAYLDAEGFGICFTGMEDACFMYLQTMLLYAADDPLITAEQFVEQFAVIRAADC